MGRVEGAVAAPAPQAHATLAVAASAILTAALLGIGGAIGSLPRDVLPSLASLLTPSQRVVGMAPRDSLSPGESVVAVPKSPELTHAERRPRVAPAEPPPPEAPIAETHSASPPVPEAIRMETKPAELDPLERKPAETQPAPTSLADAHPLETRRPANPSTQNLLAPGTATYQ